MNRKATKFHTGPNFAFKYDLQFGATAWLMAQVVDDALIVQDIKVENTEKHPYRYKTKSSNPAYQYGVKVGVANIKAVLTDILATVKESYPNVNHIVASRVTGAKKVIQASLFAKVT